MAKSRADKSDRLEVSIINFTELQVGQRLGSGGFGEVFKGRYQRYDVAIKRMLSKTFLSNSIENLEAK